jgi:TP901 family phage tail tape measure protein
MERSLDRSGSRFQAIGSKLTTGLTLPLVGAAVAATKFASDFEKATTKLVTLSGVSEKQMQLMRQAVLDMAPAVGIGPRALADALLVVTSTGFEGAAAMQILELAAKSSAIGMGDTKDVARALTSAVSAYGAENLTASAAADILHATVVAGGAEATELAGELGRVVGVASQLGVSFSEVGAFIATYTRLGLSAAEATTGLSGALNTILSPSQEARKALAEIGMSADTLRQMVAEQGLGAALTALLGKLNGNADAIGAVFGNVRALAGVMGTAGVQAQQYASVLDQIKGSTGGVNAAFEQTKKTFAFQWDQFKASAERAAITLGVQLLPAMTRILQAAKPLGEMVVAMVGWFSNLPSPVQTGVLALFGLAAAIGPVSYAIGTLLKTGAGLIGLFRTLGLATPAAAGIGLLSAPVIGFTAAIAGLVFAVPKAITALTNLWNIWSKFGTKALMGELGRNVNDDNLSFFKDWRVDQQVRRKKGGIGGAAPGVISPGALAGGAAAAAARQAQEDQLAGFGTAGMDKYFGAPTGPSGPKQKTEADRAAEEWAKELDKLSGREAISVASEWIKKVDAIGGVTKLAARDQATYNDALGEAINAMHRLGQSPSMGLLNRYVDSLRPGVVSMTAANGWGSIGEQIAAPTPPIPSIGLGPLPGFVGTNVGMPQIPKGPSFLEKAFGSAAAFGSNLSSTVMSALTGGGNLVKSLGGFLGGSLFGGQDGKGGLTGMLTGALGKTGISGMLGGALGSFLPGIGTMIGSLVGPLLGKLFGPTAYEKRTRAEAEGRKEINASVDTEDMRRKAAFTGQEHLYTQFMANRNTNTPEYLKGLLGELNSQHEQLNAAMDRYGISWESLGEKAKQSQIDEMAKQFITDFQVLTQAGVDVDLVIGKMSGSVNEFIQTAIRTGTEVPMAMQPMLQKMSEMGLLVDSTGNQIELSSLNWSVTMTQGFQQVVEAINHLTKALGYDIPAAAQAAANGMNQAFAGVQYPSVGGFVAPDGSDGSVPSYDVPQMASGGIVRARPGGTLVNVGEGGKDEAIVPLGGSGGGAGVTVILEQDGHESARWLLPYIAGEAHRLGLT